MNYPDGQAVRLWDRVQVWHSRPAQGIVVASLDGVEYSPEYRQDQWEHLASGVLIETDEAGLMHFPEYMPEIRFLRRGSPLSPAEWEALRHAQASRTEWRE